MVPWWVWVVVLLAIGAAAFLAYRAWRERRNRGRRSEHARRALTAHNETVLICVRCVGSDASAVARCVVAAFSAAQSPLRLRVAVVQENCPIDVYGVVVAQLHNAAIGTGQYFGDKVRTLNLAAGDGGSFQRAFDGWRELHEDEQYVVVLDAGVKLVDRWDVAVVDCATSVPAHVVCSAPGPGEFAAFERGPSYQRGWPVVRGRRFPFSTERPVASVALHHLFAVFRGPCFAAAPKADTHTPLYVADVAWSNQLFNGGVRFATVPGRVFEMFASYSDEHLHDQRPRSWQKTKAIALSAEYARFAGITISSRPPESSESGQGEKKESADDTQEFAVGPRATTGLTPFALQTDEAKQKYGSEREVSRVLAAVNYKLSAQKTGT